MVNGRGYNPTDQTSPPNSLSQQSPGAIATTTIFCRATASRRRAIFLLPLSPVCCLIVVSWLLWSTVTGGGSRPPSQKPMGGHPLCGHLIPSRRRRPLPGPHLCLGRQCRRPHFLSARAEPRPPHPVPPGLGPRST